MVEVHPASWGSGITFVTDRGDVPATLAFAHATPGATELRRDQVRVCTPEHLLAALRGLGVTDATIRLWGEEVPILDGSAAEWADGMVVEEGPSMDWAEVEPLHVEGFGGAVVVVPGPASLVVEVDFDGGPKGSARWAPDPARFLDEVAWARTFVLAADVDALRRAGRGRGANEHNTLVVGSGVARRADEPVVHKLLDALGDLALLPPLAAQVTVIKGSHALHLQAFRQLVLRYPHGDPGRRG